MRGEPLSRAEDEESRPAWATYQEAKARLTGNHCRGLKMGIKTGLGNLPGGRGKVEDGDPLPKPKTMNQDHGAGGGNHI